MDGDGDLDIVSGGYEDAGINWYENDGNSPPSFSEHIISVEAYNTFNIYAADIDGDDDLDLLSAQLNDGIFWHENDGSSDPSFTTHKISPEVSHGMGVFAGDVDGDGDLDVVFALGPSGHSVGWLENDGNSDPGFTQNIINSDWTSVYCVLVEDFDGDGDLDIVAGGLFSIVWYENDGGSDPNFTKNSIKTDITDVYDLDAADMDNDGDLDFLAALRYDEMLLYFRNDGASDPTFEPHYVDGDFDIFSSVHAADVDGDGDLDILAGQFYPEKIVWYESNGTGDPIAIHNVATGIYLPFSVCSGDMDGDGDVDIVSGSFYNEKIYWYENKSMHERVYLPLIIR